MKYLTRKQLQELDRKTTEEYGHSGRLNGGIPAIVLMENAGRAVADEAFRMVKHIKRPLIYIICGQGNNGGDGFVAARHLFNNRIKVNIIYTGEVNKGINEKGEAGINLRAALKMKIPIKEFSKNKVNIKQANLIIDAIFGIGLTRPVQGEIKELIELINKSGKPVIAVDVPSGLDCDTGSPLGIAVKATETVTFGAPKIGFKKKEAKKYMGKLIIADIGIPDSLL